MGPGHVVAAPASLKGVLPAPEAARALVAGFAAAGVGAEAVPVADGGEGTLDTLHGALGGTWQRARVAGPRVEPVDARWLLLPDGTGAIESAEAIGLGLVAPGERRPLETTSRGVAELMLAAVAAGARRLLVTLGGTATLEGGRGLLEVLEALPAPTTVACDVTTPLTRAGALYGPQKGATPVDVAEFERWVATGELAAVASLPGGGAAGGLGAALASLGAELRPGAEHVLRVIGFRSRVEGAALVVGGEGTVDRTTWEGKAPAAVLAACRAAGVRCVLFGGVIRDARADVDVRALSGDPARAAGDLRALAEELAGEL